MKIVKTTTTFILFLALSVLLSFSVFAASPNSYPIKDPDSVSTSIQPFYANIFCLFLTQGDNWIHADMDTYSELNLRIDIKVYKNGVLDFSDYSTVKNDDFCYIDSDYTFIAGNTYRVEAKFTAGSETTTKKISFTQK